MRGGFGGIFFGSWTGFLPPKLAQMLSSVEMDDAWKLGKKRLSRKMFPIV